MPSISQEQWQDEWELLPSEDSPSVVYLYRRKGGGGHGHSGGDGGGDGDGGEGSSGSSGSSSSGSKGSSGSSSGSSSSSSRPKGGSGSSGSSVSKGAPATQRSVPISGSTGGHGGSALAYGQGTTRIITIPAGQPFAGRTSGGGLRTSILGNRVYGSGYPGLATSSVVGRGFPFIFWPVVFGVGLGGSHHYLHSSEYGEPNNSSRPGGPMAQALFTSPTNDTNSNSTFFIVADNSTVAALLTSIQANCSLGTGSSSAPAPYNGSVGQPQPEQAVQFYRASSIALGLEGYNDTTVLDNENATALPLPGWTDQTLLECLNGTITAAAPLVSGGFLPTPNLFGVIAALLLLQWARVFKW